jgi:hypothetical protein
LWSLVHFLWTFFILGSLKLCWIPFIQNLQTMLHKYLGLRCARVSTIDTRGFV